MSDQEQQLSAVTAIGESQEIQSVDNSKAVTTDEKCVSENEENAQASNDNESYEQPSTSEKSETKALIESNVSAEPGKISRLSMPQDIRYATEQSDREKLMEKYNNYQVSEKNSCHIRFLIDYRQKKNLFGRHEEESSNVQLISNASNVILLPGYQNPPKHSFKIIGVEANVRKCLIDVLNRLFKSLKQPSVQNENENNNQQTPTSSLEKSHDIDVLNNDEKHQDKSLDSKSDLVVTSNPESSVTTENDATISPTPNTDTIKTDAKGDHVEQDQHKFIPLERKPAYSFTMLITSQGQEVLKKNWNFFAGSLQQRLNVTVVNPLKLPKFGDKQWQNELTITGKSNANIADAVLQISAFINDVLDVPNQPYKADEDQTSTDYYNYRSPHSNNYNHNSHDYHQQRRHDYNHGYRQSSSQYHGQSSPFSNQHDRAAYNRGRNGAYEQIILVRSNCAARIVGTRGSNLRRIQSKCHLRDIVVARHPNEHGYVECTITAYQPRSLHFAVDTIRSYLRNEDDQAVQVLNSHFVETPLQSSSFQKSPQHDQPQLHVTNQRFENFHQPAFGNNHYQQQTLPVTQPADLSKTNRETGFMTRPLHLNNGTQLTQPSYNFQNTPSFDFTHRPTSASRKTDKRPGEVNDCHSTNNSQARTPSESHSQQYGGSSSSNSSSVSPRHKSKRACPETKEIDCTTDDGFWIQKQYYHALDETSKQLFDSLLEKLEKIRVVSEENAARKQQRLVGRNRVNKSRAFTSSISSIVKSMEEIDLGTKSTNSTQNNEVNESTHVDDQTENNVDTANEEPTNTVTTD